MKYVIQTLEEHLGVIKKQYNDIPDDETDIYDGVIFARKEAEIKMAIKILKQQMENATELEPILRSSW